MTAVLLFQLILGYLYFGWFLGDLCLTVWLANDNSSRRANLLFPISFYKGRIGQTDVNPLSVFDIRNENNDAMGGAWYKFFMALLWPLKFVLNAPAIIVISLAVRSDVLMGRDEAVTNYDVSEKDDIPVIFRKRRALAAELERLRGKEKAINAEIERRKHVLDDAIDLEIRVDEDLAKMDAEPAKRDSEDHPRVGKLS